MEGVRSIDGWRLSVKEYRSIKDGGSCFDSIRF